MRWRDILTAWASRRYRGRHRSGLSVAEIAAKLTAPEHAAAWGELFRGVVEGMVDVAFPADDTVTQIIPTPNVVRHVPSFELPTVEFARVPAWTVTVL